MTDYPTLVLSESGRTPTLAQCRVNGGVHLSQGRSYLNLDAAELHRLVEFVTKQDSPQATTPAKARMTHKLGELAVFTAAHAKDA